MLKSLKLQKIDRGIWQGGSHKETSSENILGTHTTFEELMEFCKARSLKFRSFGASIMFSRGQKV